MKLIDDWRRVMALSLSFWMQWLGFFVIVAPEFRFMMTGQDSDPVLLFWLGALLLLAGMVGRFFKQSLSTWREWLRIVGLAAAVLVASVWLSGAAFAAPVSEQETLDIAVPFIGKEEGKRNKAYRDIVGVPTICYGSTRGVRMGMVMTDAQCTALLRSEVAEYRLKLHRYFTAKTINYRLTPKRDAAYTSLAFNAGIRGIGKSTATRRLNAGNIKGGCKALTWWNKAGGRIIRGLVKRRTREYKLCMAGL